MKKLKLLTFSLLIAILMPSIVFAWTYPSNEVDYPYANSPEDEIDQWNTFTRNCTSYVMWKINQAGLFFNNNPTGPNGQNTTMGDAGSWDEHAAQIGYTVDSNPSIGNPANWEPNSGGAGTAGHVAWVEQVHSNNTLFISEWNWNYGDGKYFERDNVSGDHYLHLINATSTCSSTISNKTVSSGETFNCSASNGGSITVSPSATFQIGSSVHLYIN
ncbi:MAG: CHAP domain-containing protein [Candidatus Dojkabacteria bacterium]